ncbi:DUF3243 domain-containing protein [Tuberibacillus calidus]|jgi:hypothetical protein|uniref:DUF3243 domain-containing protein n=1 Tax=Tuberibacillus calidus TaxID=340097 RepID=UPI0003FAA762|nr:DUF3243 domain-containing protein [Tuberibacillus calidus]
MSVLESWDDWKNFLADRLHQAQAKGISDETIANFATEIGDYLADKVDPKNEQQRVLSDLWSVANKDEQRAIANMMIKLVQNNGTGKTQ